MYLIAAFGCLMMLFGFAMVWNPGAFSAGIIAFSKKSYFHLFEILSRIAAGLIFIFYADDTVFPLVIYIIGSGLILVGIGLAFTPPRIHKNFAVWSAGAFKDKFRLIGLVSIPMSLWLVYVALGA
jgi:hypothetical protein